jgi:hypothetical protein
MGIGHQGDKFWKSRDNFIVLGSGGGRKRFPTENWQAEHR